ncbi:2-polyprenyl-6-methoxyphenol hydroxylase-like FAD-dependent oxidoreductase [Spinactinospora alkalitolerans]|uniref:2-polyprenyl-6-methoxyphenol hydroxylase-like FAD-dependent oxidoreductase n=1 Tax=Spinactinospora alkalitolerans TaxID=687207 RepID=A0A852TW87_9ACTN|nr:FAD-dependent monooxygenase [Spinactinospora alkalitolerans]NYE47122.1 2-polyprenyl-6-methoxyphenol hydroxylase-like FAD-dependent oxidoreductase [Spinactinospora alkalitolerans]
MKVLIVGCGITGSALGILLARAGAEVDIVELEPKWSTLGSGITLQGNALRVLRELGVWEQVAAAGYAFDSLGIRAPDGTLLFEGQDHRTGGHDLPATLGMDRPDLQAVLLAELRRAGARISLGRTVQALEDTGAGVDAVFDDGTADFYDLVASADGIRSRVRTMLGIADTPQPAGMGIWRVHARRPGSVTRTDLAYGGPCHIAGYCPTGADTLYAYLVEDARPFEDVRAEDKAAVMRELAAPYGGAWKEIAEDITDPDRINYTWFESLLVARPWYRANTVLLGDAAHACPPTVAQGAAMCLEDAWVLSQLLIERGGAGPDVLEAFMERRFERVRTVVDSSLQITRWQLEGARDADVPGLMGHVAALVTELP